MQHTSLPSRCSAGSSHWPHPIHLYSLPHGACLETLSALCSPVSTTLCPSLAWTTCTLLHDPGAMANVLMHAEERHFTAFMFIKTGRIGHPLQESSSRDYGSPNCHRACTSLTFELSTIRVGLKSGPHHRPGLRLSGLQVSVVHLSSHSRQPRKPWGVHAVNVRS